LPNEVVVGKEPYTLLRTHEIW